MFHRKGAERLGSQRSRLIAIGALALLALVVPATAQAHTGSASVSCTGADFTFVNFHSGSNTVHWVVLVDNATADQGDYLLDQAGGTRGTLHVPLTLYGSHSVVANAWWGPAGVADGNTRSSNSPPMVSATLDCPPLPTAPSPPTPPAPPVAPAAPSVAAVSVAAAPAPAVQVEAVHVTAPTRVARLAVASVCSTRTVRVAVNGTTMRDVTISVNGRKLKTIAVKAGTRSVRTTVPMSRTSRALIVTARVRFRNGAQARTISAPARRCAAVAVQPQFTG